MRALLLAALVTAGSLAPIGRVSPGSVTVSPVNLCHGHRGHGWTCFCSYTQGGLHVAPGLHCRWIKRR